MQLNLGTKKNFSEANMRRIISILTGLMSSVSSLEDQCIKEYNDTVTYQKGQIVIGSDGYFYEAKTVATGTWDASKWTKIGTDEFTELDVDTIKSYLNLTQEQITNLQSLIDDTTITTTKTNSSSKIYMDIQAAIAECKDDTLKQIAKKVSGSYKIATSTAEVTSADYIYLINNGSNYDLYVLVDSTPTKVGDTSIDLSDYAKLTNLDSYYDKSASDGKFATITTVDNHIDDADIHVTKELKDKLVTTDDIATTIDSSSTNDTITGTKAIYDYILANTDKFDTRGYAGDLDDVPFTIANATHCYLIYNSSCTNIPNNLTGTLYNTYFGDDKWATQLFIGLEGSIYTRNKANGTWSYWERYLRTADVTQTINSSSTDTQVPSAKAIREYSLGFKYNHEFQNSDSLNIMLPYPGFYKFATPTIGVPEGNPQDYVLLNIPWVETNRLFDTLFAEQFLFSPRVNYFWRRTVWNYQVDKYNPDSDNGTFNPWQRVCTTIVPDSEGTVTLPDGVTGTISYKVIKGICYVSIQSLADGLTGLEVVTFTGLPKADVYISIGIENSGNRAGTIYSADGVTFRVHKIVAGEGYGSFSYPVAES